MGALVKLIDLALFIFFFVIALAAPLIDSQTCLPQHLFPTFLVDIKSWYGRKYGDYLVAEKPHFFVGLVWIELLFQWPLAVACLYGIAAGKSWLNTTCLLYGVSTSTSMVAILSELTLSKRASDRLLTIYFPFLGFAVLALLRSLVAPSGKTMTIGKRPVLNRKKRV
ncbi:Transmembrane protein 97 [Abeliophyllum distichum]|uniref:Transmembrane protein 97 n=1 Tax=Abeliophyllum distichum TaxID=126358 RepID=A0ABD1UI90_9LAMI